MSQEVFTPKASGHMVFGPWNRAVHLFRVPELWVTRNVCWKNDPTVSNFLGISDDFFRLGILLGVMHSTNMNMD